MTERDYISLTIWAEARGEPVEGKIGVACILRNRVQAGRWGHSYQSVCLWPQQFSCWNAGDDPNHQRLMAVKQLIETGAPVQEPILAECYWIADGLLSDALSYRLGPHALHYHTIAVTPAWAKTGQLVARIGSQLFYQGVA